MNPQLFYFFLLSACAVLINAQAVPAPGGPTNTTTPSSNTTLTANCTVLDPEVTDGAATFLNTTSIIVRHNITDDRTPGIPLRVMVAVFDIADCQLMPTIFVDVWQCNAAGAYSQASANDSQTHPPFLRGIIEVDTDQGYVMFDTIFPGWTAGRAPHINFRVRSLDGRLVHQGELYFDDSISDAVARVAPYNANTLTRNHLAADSIFAAQAGSFGVLTAGVMNSTAGLAGGLIGNVNVIVNSTASYVAPPPANTTANVTAPAPAGVNSTVPSPAPAPSLPGDNSTGSNGTTNSTLPLAPAPAGDNTTFPTAPAPAEMNITVPVSPAPAEANITVPVSPAPGSVPVQPTVPVPVPTDNSTVPTAPVTNPAPSASNTTFPIAPAGSNTTTPVPGNGSGNTTEPTTSAPDQTINSFGLISGGYHGVLLLLGASVMALYGHL